jgi:hypothetical protein
MAVKGFYLLNVKSLTDIQAVTWNPSSGLPVSLIPVPPATTPAAPTLALAGGLIPSPYVPGMSAWQFAVTFTDSNGTKRTGNMLAAYYDWQPTYVSGRVVWSDGAREYLEIDTHDGTGSLTGSR